MSLLTRAPRPTPVVAGEVPERPALQSPYLVGALAAVQACGAGLVFAVVPVLLVWLTSPRVGARWSEAARVGADLLVLAHGAPLALPQGRVTLVPLGLTLLALALCRVGGRRVLEALLAVHDPLPRRDLLAGTATFVLAYAALVGAAAVVAGSEAVRPDALGAAAGAAVVALVAAGLPAAWSAWAPGPLRERVGVLATAVARCLVALAAAGTLLVAAALVSGRDRVLAVHEALAPGVAGHVGLVLLQLALLPVLVVWAVAYLAGPGFAVGSGTAVEVGGTTLGPLPAVPVLGGLPEPGTSWGPGTAFAAVLVVVVCGAVAGWSAARRRPEVDLREVAVDLLGLTAAAGVVVLLAGVAASGAVGPGRMAQVGPEPLLTAAVVAGEVLVGAVVGTVLAGRRVSAWVAAARSRRGPAAAPRTPADRSR
jgi:hypothetical protein